MIIEDIVIYTFSYFFYYKWRESNKPMELDIFIPSLSLAFEAQGQQHYNWHYKYGNPLLQQKRDEEKKRACGDHRVTLIHIPYWWDFRVESLAATIRKARPDLPL